MVGSFPVYNKAIKKYNKKRLINESLSVFIFKNKTVFIN